MLVLILPKERAQFGNRRLRRSVSSRSVLDSEILARRDAASSIVVNRREQWYEFYNATCCIILTTMLGSFCVECCREKAVLGDGIEIPLSCIHSKTISPEAITRLNLANERPFIISFTLRELVNEDDLGPLAVAFTSVSLEEVALTTL